MKTHITKGEYNKLDQLIINNKWSIEYDTKSSLTTKSREFYIDIIVKDETGNVVITKVFNGQIKAEKLDEIIYGEIVQILRERKLNELLS